MKTVHPVDTLFIANLSLNDKILHKMKIVQFLKLLIPKSLI